MEAMMQTLMIRKDKLGSLADQLSVDEICLASSLCQEVFELPVAPVNVSYHNYSPLAYLVSRQCCMHHRGQWISCARQIECAY